LPIFKPRRSSGYALRWIGARKALPERAIVCRNPLLDELARDPDEIAEATHRMWLAT
jgi:hypothetical protein